MQAAIIVDGQVDNIIEIDSLDVLPDLDLVDATGAQIGDLWDGERFSRPGGPTEPEAPIVPPSVTRRQARQALLLAGLLDQVQVAIDAIPDAVQRGLLQIEWDDGQTFDRDRPTVLTIGAALGLDDAGLDQLFIAAAAL